MAKKDPKAKITIFYDGKDLVTKFQSWRKTQVYKNAADLVEARLNDVFGPTSYEHKRGTLVWTVPKAELVRAHEYVQVLGIFDEFITLVYKLPPVAPHAPDAPAKTSLKGLGHGASVVLIKSRLAQIASEREALETSLSALEAEENSLRETLKVIA